MKSQLTMKCPEWWKVMKLDGELFWPVGDRYFDFKCYITHPVVSFCTPHPQTDTKCGWKYGLGGRHANGTLTLSTCFEVDINICSRIKASYFARSTVAPKASHMFVSQMHKARNLNWILVSLVAYILKVGDPGPRLWKNSRIFPFLSSWERPKVPD